MSTVAALIEERRGYVVRGLADRVAQVDAELARFGVAVDDAAGNVEYAVVTPKVETAVKRHGRSRT